MKPKDSQIHDFIRQHKTGVLATVDPNGNPHAAVIYFFTDANSNIYFLTKTGTKKADNLEHNPHAMFVIYDAASQSTAQITGQAAKIISHAELNDVFANIINASIDTSGNSVPPISKLQEGDYVAYKLEAKQIRMAEFGSKKSGEYADMFTTKDT